MDLARLIGETWAARVAHALTLAVGVTALLIEHHAKVPHLVEIFTALQWLKGHVNIAIQPQKASP